MRVVPCLRCSAKFERKSRGPVAHYCAPCRVAVKRAKNRKRMAHRRSQETPLPLRLPDEVSISLSDWDRCFVYPTGLRAAPASDRMPAGSKSPAGSDDGRSTYFKDLAAQLDALSVEAARDPWWSANPHWCFEL